MPRDMSKKQKLEEALRIVESEVSRWSALADYSHVSGRVDVLQQKVDELLAQMDELWQKHSDAPAKLAAAEKRRNELKTELAGETAEAQRLINLVRKFMDESNTGAQ